MKRFVFILFILLQCISGCSSVGDAAKTPSAVEHKLSNDTLVKEPKSSLDSALQIRYNTKKIKKSLTNPSKGNGIDGF